MKYYSCCMFLKINCLQLAFSTGKIWITDLQIINAYYVLVCVQYREDQNTSPPIPLLSRISLILIDINLEWGPEICLQCLFCL